MIADAREVCPTCAERSHVEWLGLLKPGDVVLVRNGAIHFRSCIDRATVTLIIIGTLKFRRSDGGLIRRRGAAMSARSFSRFKLVQSQGQIL